MTLGCAQAGGVPASTSAAAVTQSARGHLLIVGGGPRPDEVMHRFIQLAGGPGRARIAIVPTASGSPERTGQSLLEEMAERGAVESVVVHADGPAAADEAMAARLEGVTGVWFSGGVQSRVTAAIRGTPVETKLHELYRNGAVLGGTSAGAAIMSPLMITGEERRPGGDRPRDIGWITIDRDNVVTEPGLGFLETAIVDQHFLRRKRHNRLLSLVLEHPANVGVGIDESTAVHVHPDGRWEVLGASVAVIYDAREADVSGAGTGALGAAGVRLHVLPAGGVFDVHTGTAELAPPALSVSRTETRRPPYGSGSFTFSESAATRDRPLTVWYHRPQGLEPDAPVLFVMHGTLRNGQDYRDQWTDLADDHGFLVVVPEFSEDHWPGSRGYNLGNMRDEDGQPLPEDEWAFTVVEDLFDAVRRRFRVERDSYTIYGHSAGAQFVHRFLLFAPDARLDAAVSANAGWYTMPTTEAAYPYGLRTEDGAELVSRERIRQALERPVILLLGEEDTDPDDRYLRRNAQADAQGLHRFERGHTFFATAERRAQELGAAFNWRVRTVPDVGHSNTLMAPAAVRALEWHYDLLIRGGMVLDGTGAPGAIADVAVRGDRIARIGPGLRSRGARVIEADGHHVTPGFVDVHAHLDPIFRLPDAESHVRQGVTTALGGPDGSSPWPMGAHLDSLEQIGVGLNVAYTVGHNTVRRAVMGLDDRPARPQELERMRGMVARAMGEGALGLSTGLKYLPGAFADIDEVVVLSRVVADSGGFYTSHLRDEALDLMASVDETIEIGRRAGLPVVLSHHKVVGKPMWGRSAESLARVDAARADGVDVRVDQYPYTATHTGISILVPEWSRAGGQDAFLDRLLDPQLRDSIFRGVVENIRLDRGADDLRRVQFSGVEWDRSLEGRTLHDWAVREGMESTPETGAELIIEAVRRGGARAIFHALEEEDVRRIMRHPQTMIASDGRLERPGNGHPHPRAYGTFPRVLGHYVRDEGVLDWPDAIHKMTALPASLLGLSDRGTLTPGSFADLVIYDPDAVRDRSTFQDPHAYPVGLDWVVVNGVVTVDAGEFRDTRAGRILRRTGSDGTDRRRTEPDW